MTNRNPFADMMYQSMRLGFAGYGAQMFWAGWPLRFMRAMAQRADAGPDRPPAQTPARDAAPRLTHAGAAGAPAAGPAGAARRTRPAAPARPNGAAAMNRPA
jgi:hypothetical protein